MKRHQYKPVKDKDMAEGWVEAVGLEEDGEWAAEWAEGEA